MIALVIGATRGLGRRVAEQYASAGATVFGTARKQPEKDKASESIQWISGVDVSMPTASETIIKSYKESLPIDVLVVSAGYFGKESFNEPDWDAEERMYKTSAIGPVFLVTALVKAGLLKQGSKVVMISSEAGSITLRHEKEGGGNYGHHASKAALNMVTKLLSLDLKPRGIPIVAIHPGFMRTEMTKNVGFDQYWDSGGGGYNSRGQRVMLTVINSRYAGRGGQIPGPLDRQRGRHVQDRAVLGTERAKGYRHSRRHNGTTRKPPNATSTAMVDNGGRRGRYLRLPKIHGCRKCHPQCK